MAAEADVLGCFHAFRDALKANDAEALDRLMTQAYRSFNLRGGLESRETVLEAYQSGSTVLEVWEVSDLQVEVFGEIGVLTGKGYLAGTWQGQGWSHHLRFVDVYLKTKQGWRLHFSQATPLGD